jgi:hypothetical protein
MKKGNYASNKYDLLRVDLLGCLYDMKGVIAQLIYTVGKIWYRVQGITRWCLTAKAKTSVPRQSM